MNRGGSFRQAARAGRAIPVVATLALVCALAPSSFASVRGQVIKVCRSETRKTKGEVRESYCKSAKDYLNARNSHTAGSMVWSGVAAVCTRACADPTRLSSVVCNSGQLSGSASNAVIEKNFVEALSPTNAEAAVALKKKLKKKAGEAVATETAVNGAGTVAGLEPCKSALSATQSSLKKFSTANQEKKKIYELKDTASKLDEKPDRAIVNFGTEIPDGSSAVTAGQGTLPGENPACAEEKLTSALAVLHCATSTNPDLPQGVATQEFLRDLEKATGQTADQFFSNFKDPATSLYNGVSPSLSDSQKQALAQSIRDLHKESLSLEGTSAVAQLSGGKRQAAQESGDFDMAGALNQLFDQLGEGTQNEPSSPPGVQGQSFATARRPAHISPEDTSFSIFERVKLRYSAMTQKLHLGEERQ